MNEMMQAAAMLQELVGQNKIMALATRYEEGVASRTVNVYIHQEKFYFVTEADSNKFAQLKVNPRVALSADAIQITGEAKVLQHPLHDSNQTFRDTVETVLPGQFERYGGKPAMRLIEIVPRKASLLSLQTGTGYIMDYVSDRAQLIRHEG